MATSLQFFVWSMNGVEHQISQLSFELMVG